MDWRHGPQLVALQRRLAAEPLDDGEACRGTQGHADRDRPVELDDRRAALVRGGDVEEHELVRARLVVEGRELDRVTRLAQLEKARALDDTPGVHVEAGDHALQLHSAAIACASVKRRSYSALPMMTPASRG